MRVALFFKNNKKIFYLLSLIVLTFLIFIFLFFRKIDNAFVVDKRRAQLYEDYTVEKEDHRVDTLIMGIRGANDPDGGLLTDTIMLVSFNEETKKTAIISIPRDLYVKMPEGNFEKINAIYALGMSKEQGELNYVREVIQYISGVYVDHTVIVNFDAFKSLIDIMGGVTINRQTVFSEPLQWQKDGKEGNPYWIYHYVENIEELPEENLAKQDLPEQDIDGENINESQEEQIPIETEEESEPQSYWEFRIPAGQNLLTGEDALYYIRSRFSSNDFSRIRRQQEVISALKNKAISLNVLTNFSRISSIIDELGNNVVTDTHILKMRNLLGIIEGEDDLPVNQIVLEPTEDGLLNESRVDGQYVIVPSAGDWSEVREFFEQVLSNEND